MTPPLTDEELERLEKTCKGTWSAFAYADVQDGILSALAELRHHRSRELSAEDVEALRHVADELREQIEHWQMLAKTNGWGFSPGQKSRALAALHRLCGSKP